MDTIIIFSAKYLILVSVVTVSWYWLKATKEIKKKMFILGIIALPLAYIISKIGSHLYMDPRPFVEGNFTPLIEHARDNGFPSDHTLLAAALAALMYVFNKTYGGLLFVIAIIIGLSRVLAGVHHFVDIVGSIVIATLAVFIVNTLLRKYSSVFKN